MKEVMRTRREFMCAAAIALIGSRLGLENKILGRSTHREPFPVSFDTESSIVTRLKNPVSEKLSIVSEEEDGVWKTKFFKEPFKDSEVLTLNHAGPIKAVGEMFAGEIYLGEDLTDKELGLIDSNLDGSADFGLWYRITILQIPVDGRLLDRYVRATNAYPLE